MGGNEGGGLTRRAFLYLSGLLAFAAGGLSLSAGLLLLSGPKARMSMSASVLCV
jgi:hypothetical protein